MKNDAVVGLTRIEGKSVGEAFETPRIPGAHYPYTGHLVASSSLSFTVLRIPPTNPSVYPFHSVSSDIH